MTIGSVICCASKASASSIALRMALALLAAWSTPSSAASPCAPWEDRAGLYGEVIEHGLKNGPYLTWMCAQIVDASGKPAQWGQWRITRHCIEGPWVGNTLSQLGGRAETIRKAVDPVASFHASIKRYVKAPSTKCRAILDGYRGVKL